LKQAWSSNACDKGGQNDFEDLEVANNNQASLAGTLELF